MKKIVLFFILAFTLGQRSINAQVLKTIDRDSFSVKYPESWSIDKEDEDYDPDALFSLDSEKSDGASVMFMIFNLPIDPDEMLDEQVKNMTATLIKKPTSITDFDAWGKLKGKGKIIKGKMLGVFKGSIRLFMYTDKSKSMLIMEQFSDSDEEKIGKDFRAIADSFVFK